ncbi:multiple sugar transport system substrate-binding protein [Thermocatellispora tengchongensis]|uniref:Multiple sugar transport system substrate-binding protein n=1 Tax=Thermocatellispora tengchongensis TaxID=1073253 RepID=A0A840PKB2_9ACTN|nr:sugar ABC transporter substrate-binding protein [Thermocatellispora tengchongensis]MBB5138353.1 multiple sugar transport system substrate-binding protein [Thermocatellispora tengchongensis]
MDAYPSRRAVLTGLGALGAVGALAACGGTARTPQTAEGRSTGGPGGDLYPFAEAEKLNASLTWPASIGEPASKVVITVASHWEAAFLPRQEQFDHFFMRRHPNIEVRREITPFAQFLQKYLAQAAGGSLPDIMYSHYSWVSNFVKQGVFLSVSAYAAKQPGFEREDFTGPSLGYFERGGQLYGLPYDCGPKLLFYNKDLFDAAGVAYPTASWTIEEMLDAAVRLARGKGAEKVFGMAGLPAPIADLTPTYLLAYGGRYLDPTETRCLIDQPGAVNALRPWFDLLHKHKAVPSAADAEAMKAEPFSIGRAAMGVHGSWNAPNLAANARFRWAMADMPSGPEGRFTSAVGSGFAITAGSKAKDAAWIYLNELTSPAGQIFMWGSTGRGSPSRTSAWPSYLESKLAPEGAGLLEKALNDYATNDGVIRQPAGPKVVSVATPTWDRMASGRIAVPEGLRKIRDDVTPVLVENR